MTPPINDIMLYPGISPTWFLGFDALFEFLFLLIIIPIVWYSLRVYKLSGNHRFLWWGVGFGSIGIAYAINSFANYYLFANILGTVSSPVPSVIDTHLLHFFGYLSYTGFMLTGYFVLSIVALRFHDRRLVTLFASIIGLLALAIVTSHEPLLLNATIIFLLIHILVFTLHNTKAYRSQYSNLKNVRRSHLSGSKYRVSKNVSSRVKSANSAVLVGFSLLLLAQILYLLLPFWCLIYVISHVVQLAGYTALFASMFVIMKK